MKIRNRKHFRDGLFWGALAIFWIVLGSPLSWLIGVLYALISVWCFHDAFTDLSEVRLYTPERRVLTSLVNAELAKTDPNSDYTAQLEGIKLELTD